MSFASPTPPAWALGGCDEASTISKDSRLVIHGERVAFTLSLPRPISRCLPHQLSNQALSAPVFKPGTSWHLALPGAHTCDTGVVASQAQCAAAVRELAAVAGRVPGRALQIGSGGRCLDIAWGQVPIGCSAQNNSWTAHYKTSGDTGAKCIGSM